MRCACSQELGPVTSRTKGLCPKCGRSKWMQAALARLEQSCRDAPGIASQLQRGGVEQCAHGHSVCFSRCGVELTRDGWKVVTLERRREWFSNVMRLSDKESKR